MEKTELREGAPLSRSAAIDILRIILCIGVFVYHLTPERCSSGPLSVNGFLVLSGFLVGMSLFSRSSFDLEIYYSSKCRRLLPIFLMTLVISVGGRYIIRGSALPAWSPEQWGKFSISDILQYFNVPMWYMVVEFAMLLMVPFFVFLSRNRWRLELFWAGLFVFTWFLFSQIPDNAPFGMGLYFSPLARAWQFVAALLVGRYLVHEDLSKLAYTSWYKIAIGILFVVFVVAELLLMILKQGRDLNYWNYTFEFDVLTTLFFIILVPGLYFLRLPLSVRISRILAFAAAMTYPVFLIHVALRGFSATFIGKLFGLLPYYVTACTTFVFSLIAAWCLLWVDARIQRLFKR